MGSMPKWYRFHLSQSIKCVIQYGQRSMLIEIIMTATGVSLVESQGSMSILITSIKANMIAFDLAWTSEKK